METTKPTLVKRLGSFSWWIILIVLGWTLATCNRSTKMEEQPTNDRNLSSETNGQQDEDNTIQQNAKPKPTLSQEGYIYENGRVPIQNRDLRSMQYNLQIKNPTGVESYGDLISRNLANRLVLDFYTEFSSKIEKSVKNNFSKSSFKNNYTEEDLEKAQKLIIQQIKVELSKELVYQISFSKQAVSMLLAQPNCTGIKAYYCLGPSKTGLDIDRKPSIILVGVTNNNHDIGIDTKPTGSNPNASWPRNIPGKLPSIIYIDKPNDSILYDNPNKARQPEVALIYEVGGTDGENVKTFEHFAEKDSIK